MNPTISSTPVRAPLIDRERTRDDLLTDYELGGPTLGDSSTDYSYLWTATTDGTSVFVGRDGVTPVAIFADVGISAVSLAFDSAMNVYCAYVAGGVAKFRYWDSLANAYAVMTLTGDRTPLCATDEHTPQFSADRDVVLTYLRDAKLYIRLQRDRFTVEYEKVLNAPHEPLTNNSKLISFGMSTARRLQWRYTTQ